MNSNFRFFDKNGNRISPNIDNDGIFNITLELDDVSVNLFETEQLHIFEEVYVPKNINDIGYEYKAPKTIDNKIKNILHIINRISYEKICNIKDIVKELSKEYPNLFPNKDELSKYYNEYETYIQTYDMYIKSKLINGANIYYLTQLGEESLSLSTNQMEKQLLELQGFIPFLVKPRFKRNLRNLNTFIGFDWKTNNNKINNALNVFDIQSINNEPIINTYDNIALNEINTNFINFITKKSNGKLVNGSFINNYICDDSSYDDKINNIIFEPQKILTQHSQYSTEPITINLYSNSSIEGHYENILQIYLIGEDGSRKLFANIKVCANIIGEDERLDLLLTNFGRKIEESDFYVVRDYDMEDDLVDYIKINEKRKELLLVGEDIYPFLGSYKALKNGIKWLGYQDLTVREYFYNIKTWTKDNIDYKYVDVDLEYSETYNPNNKENKAKYVERKYSNLIHDKDWKKTSRLGLIYNFNKFTGRFNQDGLPEIKNIDEDFNAIELVVKLYGLKQILYKYFLPHNARIINITLEGIYFTKVSLREWTNINPISIYNKNPHFDFICKYPNQMRKSFTKLLFYLNNLDDDFNLHPNMTLQELEQFKNKLYLFSVEDFTEGNSMSEEELNIYEELKTFLIDNFENDIELLDYIQTFLNNKKQTGGIFHLKLIIDKILIRDRANFSYESNNITTFNQDIYNDKCRIVWTIKHTTSNYIKKIQGINKKEILLFLPLTGSYDVIATIFDESNFPMTVIKSNYLNLNDKDFNIFAFGKSALKIDASYNSNPPLRYNEIDATYQSPIVNAMPYSTYKEIANISYQQFNFSNYLQSDYYLDFCKYSDISIEDNKIKIHNGIDFFSDYNKYKNNWKGLYLLKNDRLGLNAQIKITNIINDNITFYSENKIKLFKNDLIQLYELYETSAFTVESKNKLITIKVPKNIDINIFKNDSIITLKDGQNREKDFKCNYVDYNYNDNIVKLTIIDEYGDFYFQQSMLHDRKYKYNYSKWQVLTLKYNKETFIIKEINDNENKIILKNKYNVLYRLSNLMLNGHSFFMDSEIVDQKLIKLNIKDVDVINNQGNTFIEYNKKIQLLANTTLIWAPFDVFEAKCNSKQERLEYCHCLDYKYNDMKTQTYDTMTFTGDFLTKFSILNVNEMPVYFGPVDDINNPSIPKLIVNGYTYPIIVRIDDVTENVTNTEILKLEKLKDYLNNIKIGPLHNFYFIVNLTKKTVEAVSKSRLYPSIFNITSNIFKIENGNTIPKNKWYLEQIEYFDSKLSPNLSNIFYRNFLDDQYDVGRFTFKNMFIKQDSFFVDGITPIFITIDNIEYFDLVAYDFDWTISHNEKIIHKSKLNYITYNINDNGAYSITLMLTNKDTKEQKIKNKINWFFKK